MNVRFPRLLIISALLTAAPAGAAAESAAALVERGNEAYNQGDYGRALERYRQAGEREKGSPEVAFNEGAAHYQLKEYKDAAHAFEEAALQAGDKKLAAESLFNLGNTHFRIGEQEAEQQRVKEAIAALEQSAVHYREALERDPAFSPAGENLELARTNIARLKEELQKQAQQQQQQEKSQQQEQAGAQEQNNDQNAAEQLQALRDRQKELRDKTRDAARNEQEIEQTARKDKEQDQRRPTASPSAAPSPAGAPPQDAGKLENADSPPDESRDILEEERRFYEDQKAREGTQDAPIDKDW